MECNCPIEYFKTVDPEDEKSKIVLTSNWGDSDLKLAKEKYKNDKNESVLMIELHSEPTGVYDECITGLTMDQAKELRMALDSMISYIEGD